VIETQPVAPAGTLFVTGSFTLTAGASGSPTLVYQRRKGGTNLAGQTAPSLTLTGVTVADAGSYDVVVSNGSGSVTSNVVNIAISSLTQPVFTTTPVGQTLYVGYPATFTSLASGGDLTYTWRKGATVVGSAAVLTLPAITAADAGTYTVTASNIVGNVSAPVVLGVNTPVPGTYEAVQASQKPLLWYRYSETTPLVTNTGTATNIGTVGSAGTATVKRYMPFQRPGALVGDSVNKAAAITLNSQFIDIPYHADLNPAVFTAELWVKPPPVNAGRFDPLINRGPAAGDGFLFFGWNGVTKWQFRCYSGTTRTQVNSTVDIVAGKWTHLVGVYDGTTAHLYVDGVEQTAGTTGAYTPNTVMPMRLGGFPNDNGDVGGGSFSGGSLDEVAIYPTALTAAEVLAHFTNGTTAAPSTPYQTLVQSSTPAGYWRLNDAAGPTAPAPRNSGTAGSAWTGSYGGDITPAVAGPRPPEDPGFEAANAGVATVVNGYNAVPPLNVTTNTLTVTTWIKRATTFTTSDLGWPAWLGAGGGFHIDGTSGRPYGELRYHWEGSQWAWGSGLQVPDGIWTFCALVIEPTRATVYMGDGDKLKKSSVNATHTPHLLNAALAFGGNQSGNTGRNFIGQLDESAFYDRVLTETELVTLFIKGSGAPFNLDIQRGGVLDDTKPIGAPIQGLNLGSTWAAAGVDGASTVRAGVQEFSLDSSQQIAIPTSPEFASPTGTVMFWMKATTPTGAGSTAAMLFDHRTTSGLIAGLSDAGYIYVQCFPMPTNEFSDNTFVADGNWHHVAITYNQDASGSIQVYVDGAPGTENFNTAGWTWPSGQQIVLGKSRDPYWRRFAGALDDFRFYNQILAPAEIAAARSTGAIGVPTALNVRYEFGTAGSGFTLAWPFGNLETSTLQPGSPWLPVPGAISPLPILPTNPARFYRATLP
jgi:Concanavalin A-like lectin/glucanases superfamily